MLQVKSILKAKKNYFSSQVSALCSENSTRINKKNSLDLRFSKFTQNIIGINKKFLSLRISEKYLSIKKKFSILVYLRKNHFNAHVYKSDGSIDLNFPKILGLLQQGEQAGLTKENFELLQLRTPQRGFIKSLSIKVCVLKSII